MILDHTYVCSAYGSDCLLLPLHCQCHCLDLVIYMLIYAWWLLSWLILLYVHIHAYLDDPLFSLAMCMHLVTLYFCYICLSVSMSFIVLYQITWIYTSDSACSLLLILCIYMHICVSCPIVLAHLAMTSYLL